MQSLRRRYALRTSARRSVKMWPGTPSRVPPFYTACMIHTAAARPTPVIGCTRLCKRSGVQMQRALSFSSALSGASYSGACSRRSKSVDSMRASIAC
eukprot:351204-Chlamydomonas_euryale.AAC.2